MPWNFPLMNAVLKIAPAPACGCTLVLKPAELTSLSALWIRRAALEAGLPRGVLNVVASFGGHAGAARAAHPGVDKIAFTGWPQTGQFIKPAAAEHITRIGLELGGKSPSVADSKTPSFFAAPRPQIPPLTKSRYGYPRSCIATVTSQHANKRQTTYASDVPSA